MLDHRIRTRACGMVASACTAQMQATQAAAARAVEQSSNHRGGGLIVDGIRREVELGERGQCTERLT